MTLVFRSDRFTLFDNGHVGHPYPMLLLFVGSDVTFSDLTITDKESNPVERWREFYWQEESNSSFGAILEFVGESPMKVIVNRA